MKFSCVERALTPGYQLPIWVTYVDKQLKRSLTSAEAEPAINACFFTRCFLSYSRADADHLHPQIFLYSNLERSYANPPNR